MAETLYHVPTAYVLAGVVFLVVPLLTWFTLRQERSRAVSWWIGGSLLMSCGLLALGLRRAHPDLLPFNTGFVLLVVGEVIHLCALDIEQGHKPRMRWWVTAALAAVLVKEAAYQMAPDAAAHYLLSHFTFTVLLLAVGLQARRLALAENLRSARWLSHFSLMASMVYGLRTLLGLMGLSDAAPVNDQVSGVLTTFVVIALAFMDNFAMIGIYMERSNKRISRLQLEEERARASAKLTAQVAHLDRQRSMGELAAGLAHELGQPIASIVINACTLEQTLARPGSAAATSEDIARDIVDQASRAKRILEGIRNFIQPGATALSCLRLTEVIDGALAMLGPAIKGKEVSVQVSCSSAAPWVRGDVVQLSQVLLNLLRNALQARRPDAALTIAMRVHEDGDWLDLEVEDNGQGMSDEDLKRWAEPFFTTKPDGLGVGLPICRRILEHHGGSLLLDHAASGQGVCATLRLPRAAAPRG